MHTALNPFSGLGHAMALRLRHAARIAPAAVDSDHCGERTLAKGASFCLPRPLGVEVVCVEGTLWITHDGDPKDIVLRSGQRYRADCRSRLLVHALDAAMFCLTPR